MNFNQLRTPALAVALSFATSLAYSATIVVPDDINDFESQKRSDTGVYIASENNLQARAGFQSNFNGAGTNAPGGIMPVTFFQLPALAPGESVTSASYSVSTVPDSATTVSTPTFNGDLYILGLVSSIGKTAADAQNYWYIGNTAQAALPGTAGSTAVSGTVSRVMDNFIVPADFVANGGAESAPHLADITSYIQNLYANPVANGFTPGSSFLVVRISPDADSPPTTGTQRYELASQGTAANQGIGANRPKITLETTGGVPEPSTLVLMIVLSTGVLCYRRVSI